MLEPLNSLDTGSYIEKCFLLFDFLSIFFDLYRRPVFGPIRNDSIISISHFYIRNFASLAGPDAGTAVLLDFDLRTHQGTLSANLQEVAALHVAILRERPQATSVIHTHSLYLTAHAIARRPLRPYSSGLLGLLREDQQIPVSEWGPRYASQPVVDLLRDDTTAPAVLLANHGPFAWSEKGVLGAARLLVALEDAAHLALLAEQLGGAQALPAGAAELARRGWQAP